LGYIELIDKRISLIAGDAIPAVTLKKHIMQPELTKLVKRKRR
jgi:hypothetical protein